MMRVTRKEIEKTFAQMEKKYDLRNNLLSEIYRAEADVVFMGRRRDILKQIRRILVKNQVEKI